MLIYFRLSVPLARNQRTPQPGRCIVCGCTEKTACIVDGFPCRWADVDRLLCSGCFDAPTMQYALRRMPTLGGR